ncbi:4a-hydroxytetrahydrobiopterin dehydratase [Agrococcus beijingensis]|uniref:4a-hydroxytetrahydrobiopterin dehydratase n=1 Tax=Agrococcus beijingensis TaxID=3068634 RepID=UPI0027415015|nr:4a-hydroxytetrahydrobiopterin dehydratase [Agrococcus sp. REN33]
MQDPKQQLTASEIADAGLTGWRHVDDTLTARFRTGSFATGLELVNRVGASAEAANHHPDVQLTYGAVEVTLTSHDAGGVTGRDLRLAREVSEHATAMGIETAEHR